MVLIRIKGLFETESLATVCMCLFYLYTFLLRFVSIVSFINTDASKNVYTVI